MPELSHDQQRLLQHGWPWPLVKATVDAPFDCAIGLKDGTVIRFQSAAPGENPDWVTLAAEGLKFDRRGALLEVNYRFERGLVLRVSEIVWAADAPAGS